jgi:type VI protein secretion system component Hcp
MGGRRRAACVLAIALGALLTCAATPPTPTPRATPTPTARPTPTPAPTVPPTPPPPPPPCDTRVPQATRSGGFLQLAGVPGDAKDAAHAGAIVLTGASPDSMLPPAVGTVPLTEMTLVKDVDSSSPALLRAVAGARHFDCAQVEMGPSRDYLYATYAFHDAQFARYAPSGDQQTVELLTLTYGTVDWEYQPRDGSAVVTGSGALGATPNPRGLAQPVAATTGLSLPGFLLPLGVGLVVIAFLSAVISRWRRRRGNPGRGSRHL